MFESYYPFLLHWIFLSKSQFSVYPGPILKNLDVAIGIKNCADFKFMMTHDQYHNLITLPLWIYLPSLQDISSLLSLQSISNFSVPPFMLRISLLTSPRQTEAIDANDFICLAWNVWTYLHLNPQVLSSFWVESAYLCLHRARCPLGSNQTACLISQACKVLLSSGPLHRLLTCLLCPSSGSLHGSLLLILSSCHILNKLFLTTLSKKRTPFSIQSLIIFLACFIFFNSTHQYLKYNLYLFTCLLSVFHRRMWAHQSGGLICLVSCCVICTWYIVKTHLVYSRC